MKNRIVIATCLFLTACSTRQDQEEKPRLVEPHAELKVEALSGNSAQAIISVGSIYLESQMEPMKVNGVFLQASDVSINGSNIYVSYSSVDNGGIVVKKGAVEHIQAYACSIGLLYTSYCLKSISKQQFHNADIFATKSDGTNLYAVGSTSDEDAETPARLYKIALDSGKLKNVTGTTVLPSYAGTGVWPIGSNVIVSSGTSTDATKRGGLSLVNTSTMAITASQSLYDARDVGANGTTSVFVTRGKLDSSNAGAVVEYNANLSGSALRTIQTGGNTIAESKSSILVGDQLLLVSMGDQGFKVVCKSSGATLLTKAAPVVTGIPAARTVTNSVAAAPGFIFAANGEAGLYVYRFEKTSLSSSNLCNGVQATLLGRVTLKEDDTKSYIDGELSANSVRYQVVNGQKLLAVASGNKGVSLINISGLTISLNGPVDDF